MKTYEQGFKEYIHGLALLENAHEHLVRAHAIMSHHAVDDNVCDILDALNTLIEAIDSARDSYNEEEALPNTL